MLSRNLRESYRLITSDHNKNRLPRSKDSKAVYRSLLYDRRSGDARGKLFNRLIHHWAFARNSFNWACKWLVKSNGKFPNPSNI